MPTCILIPASALSITVVPKLFWLGATRPITRLEGMRGQNKFYNLIDTIYIKECRILDDLVKNKF